MQMDNLRQNGLISFGPLWEYYFLSKMRVLFVSKKEFFLFAIKRRINVNYKNKLKNVCGPG